MNRHSQNVENQTSFGSKRESVRKRFDNTCAKGQVTCNEHPTAAIYAPLLFGTHKRDVDIRKLISNCWDYCRRKKWEVRYVFVEQCAIENTRSKLDSYRILEKAEAENLNFIVFWELRLSKVDYIKVERVRNAPRQLGPTVPARAGELAETKSVAQRI